MQLIGQFPFKDTDSVLAFWDELYMSDYKLNQVYYEKQIKEAMPEIFELLPHGEQIFTRQGPAESFVQVLQNVDTLWNTACQSYELHYDAIKDKLPEELKDLCSDNLQDTRLIDIGMPEQGTLIIQLDTRFTDLNANGIDQICLTFKGVKSIKTEGAIRLRTWLYNEVYFHENDTFELRVLLEDGELAFVANSIEVKRQNRFANIFA